MAHSRARGSGFGVSSDVTLSTQAATILRRNACNDVRKQRRLTRKRPLQNVIGWRQTIEA